jgi:hypothetical protein
VTARTKFNRLIGLAKKQAAGRKKQSGIENNFEFKAKDSN